MNLSSVMVLPRDIVELGEGDHFASSMLEI